MRFAINSLSRRLLDRMVLRPSQQPIHAGSQRRETFSSQLGDSEYFVHSVGNTDAPVQWVVVKFPGTAGRAERSSPFPLTLLPHFQDPQFHGQVLTWNPPGYGGSQGRATLPNIAATSREFLDHVSQRYLADDPVFWLCGNSLGCNQTFFLARSDQFGERVDGIIVRNPPPLIDVVQHVAARYPMGRWVRSIAETLIDEMNAPLNVAHVKCPAVFLQSEADTLVLPSFQNALIQDYAGPTQVVQMEGLDHQGIANEQHEWLIADALKWLWKHSTSSPATSFSTSSSMGKTAT